MSRRRDGHQRGAATAELAVTLPLLVSFTIGLTWMVSLAGSQVRAIDAAREAARVLARGDSDVEARRIAQAVAPAHAEITLSREGPWVRAVVVGHVRGPGGIFAGLPAPDFRAEAVAVAESMGPSP